MLIGPAPEGPAVLPLLIPDRQVVDAGDAQSHQPLIVEFPVLVPVASIPLAAVIVPFVGKPHGNAISRECPEFLDQSVIELPGPFSNEECLNGLAAVQKL